MALHVSPGGERADLQGHLLRLAEAVDRAIVSANWALAHADTGEAQHIADGDRTIDALRYGLEEHAILLLAGRVLLADEARTITSMMQIATELEQIGNHVTAIATIILRNEGQAQRSTSPALSQMAHKAREMLQQAIRAVVRRDSDVAVRLEPSDAVVDTLYQRVRCETLTSMREHPEHAEWETYHLWVGYHVKRIADRALIIGQRAAFMVTGVMS